MGPARPSRPALGACPGGGLSLPALLVVALVAVPLVEIYVLLQVGQLLGVVPTLVLLVAMSLVGAWLLRREGTKAWQAFGTALTSGRLPAKEVADGALVIFGGALLLTPGFATDAFGLLCVIPPSRAVLRRLLTRSVAQRLGVGGLIGGWPGGGRPSSGRTPQPPGGRGRSGGVVGGDVVEGETAAPDDRQDPPGRPGGTLPPA